MIAEFLESDSLIQMLYGSKNDSRIIINKMRAKSKPGKRNKMIA